MKGNTLIVNSYVSLCPTDDAGLINCTECYKHHDGYCTVDPMLVKLHDMCFSESMKRRRYNEKDGK